MAWRRGVFWTLVVLLLVPGASLTALRVTDPQLGHLVRAQSLTPLAVVPYALVLVLLAAWSWRHRSQAWVLVVPLVGLGLHAHWLAPEFTGATPPPNPKATPLVVMTANLEVGLADGVEVVRTALRRHVDVLVLEEVTPGVLATMDRAGLAQLLPDRVGSPAEGNLGTMVFARGAVTEMTQPDPPSYRSVLATVQTSDGPLRVFAVHPSSPAYVVSWRSDHARLNAIAQQEHPDLVVGDFNATLDQLPMRQLEDWGYRSAAELANVGWQPTWPTWGSFSLRGVIPLPPVAQIDHVLVGPGMTALGASTAEVPGTDHLALVATVAPE